MAEKALELAIGPHQINGRTVIHHVIRQPGVIGAAFGISLGVIDLERAGHVPDFCRGSRERLEAWMEVARVSPHLGHIIALRVDGDEDRHRLRRQLGPALFQREKRLGHRLQCHRADIGAEGEAEIDQPVFPGELGAREFLAGFVRQRKRAADCHLRRGLVRCRRMRSDIGVEPGADGEGRQERQRRQDKWFLVHLHISTKGRPGPGQV